MRRCLSFVALCIGVASAGAHETWLLPRTAAMPAPGAIGFAMSSGMDFPKADTAVAAENFVRAAVRIGATTTPIKPVSAIGGNAILRADLASEGIATAYVELRPIALTLTPALVEEYLDEIKAGPLQRDAWRAQATREWRERYVKFAKAFVRVGRVDASDRSWSQPIGGPLEIVPLVDPTRLAPGGALDIVLLKDGQPLAGQPLAIMTAGRREWLETNAGGRARFVLAGGGPWMIHGTELRPPAQPGGEWLSWFTTLTIPRFESEGGATRK